MQGFLNLVAGEMLSGVGFNPDILAQQIQAVIILIGSNPFFG